MRHRSHFVHTWNREHHKRICIMKHVASMKEHKGTCYKSILKSFHPDLYKYQKSGKINSKIHLSFAKCISLSLCHSALCLPFSKRGVKDACFGCIEESRSTSILVDEDTGSGTSGDSLKIYLCCM